MMGALRRNLGYKFASLVIAALLYFIASAQQNPRTSQDIYVQPEIVRLPSDMVISEPPKGYLVKARGLAADVEALRMRGVQAVVNASTATRTGAVRLPVEYRLPPELEGRVDIPGPRMVSFTVDRKTSQTFGVEVPPVGQAPAGYEFRAPNVRPAQVTVAGLESAVKRVDRVVASLDATTRAGSVNQDVSVVAQDASRQVVENVEIRPNHVHVFIGLEERRPSTTLWLSSRFVGEPAPGYEYVSHQLDPQFVPVEGSVERLAGLASLAVPVDLTDLKENTTQKVTLRPPPGIRILGSPEVTVTIQVRPQARPDETGPARGSASREGTPRVVTPRGGAPRDGGRETPPAPPGP